MRELPAYAMWFENNTFVNRDGVGGGGGGWGVAWNEG